MTDTFLAYVVFAAVAAFTPGPNNLMVSASGANYGYRRTFQHVLGVTIGFPVMLVAIGLGIGSVFTEFPLVHTMLKYVGAAYLLFLAWQIVSAAPRSERDDAEEHVGGKPLTFMQAALFQWVNPKAWTVNVSAVAAYTTMENYSWQLTLMVIAAGVIAFFSASTWTLFGQGISRLLSTPFQQRAFNTFMGLLLVGSLYPILLA